MPDKIELDQFAGLCISISRKAYERGDTEESIRVLTLLMDEINEVIGAIARELSPDHRQLDLGTTES